MAVKYDDVKRGISETPLNEHELSVIDKIEKFIDNKIETEFDNRPIYLATGIINFTFDPTTDKGWAFEDIKETRKSLMANELRRRYEDNGWQWKLEQGEDDGPSRPAIDFWVLKGKSC
jgi:hypothetical protein